MRKLVDQLKYFDELRDRLLFFTGATAKWSLASNAQSDERARAIFEAARVDADNRTRELIDELLAQGPAIIKQQMAEILRKQHDAGLWK